jgi:hypothetical protein
LFGYFRDAVRIGQTARAQTGQDGFERIRLKADQIEVETAKVEVAELVTEPLEVPARPRRQLVVGQAISALLLLAPAARDDHRDGFEPSFAAAPTRAAPTITTPFSSTSGGMVHPNSTMEAAILSMSASV